MILHLGVCGALVVTRRITATVHWISGIKGGHRIQHFTKAAICVDGAIWTDSPPCLFGLLLGEHLAVQGARWSSVTTGGGFKYCRH